MSQRAVEQVLGKLVTDERFRAVFLADPERACLCAGLELSPDERRAMAAIPAEAIATFAECLQDRIRRLCFPGQVDRLEERP
jgi:hypothetical protein